NSLRRLLFITVPGAAITRIKIKGATHLFTNLPGVKEDLVEVSLNLKKIKFSYKKDEPIKLFIKKIGPGIVTAADIKGNDLCFVTNPDQHIATLSDKKSSFELELMVERGLGYTLAKEQKTDIVGEIILDAAFTPIVKVNYFVEPTRLAKKLNHDKLTMEIWTDGSIDSLEALKLSAKKLIDSLSQIYDPQEFEEEVVTIESSPMSLVKDMSVEEIELPLRVTNALKKSGYSTIESLVKDGRAQVSRAKNVGEKSLKIIDNWLKEKSISWN
ncbi:DNA-directed RNA polymerase subunit alpha, partial [Patescibacteria group bacterium]|nr:DNA-directed RNA polymerase subunit alpha [Patescibacteria group bacterium]